jgi:hypothetical protein
MEPRNVELETAKPLVVDPDETNSRAELHVAAEIATPGQGDYRIIVIGLGNGRSFEAVRLNSARSNQHRPCVLMKLNSSSGNRHPWAFSDR